MPVDKGKPRVTWGRKATGLDPSRVSRVAETGGGSAMKPAGFAADRATPFAVAVRIAVILFVAFAGFASAHP